MIILFGMLVLKEDFATFDYTAYVINGTDIIPLSDDPNPYPYINTESEIILYTF